MLYFLQQLVNGLHIGAIYALLAFGYALTNGVLHRTNLAHGAIFGFAGQILILMSVFGYRDLWLTLPATLAFGILGALLCAALASFMLSRSVLERLAARSPNAIVVATLGVALVLMELGRIGADTHDLWLPPLLSQPVVFVREGSFAVTLTTLQVIDCAVAASAILLGAWAVAASRFGRAWRAVSDDPAVAALCGIDTATIFRGAVMAGGLFAALAGVMAVLHFGNLGFGAGLVFGLKVLFVTAVGGYRAPAAAALGAALFGIGESLWSGYFPIEWRDGWMFSFLVVLLVLRAQAPAPEDGAKRLI